MGRWIKDGSILLLKELFIVAIGAVVGVAALALSYLVSHDALFGKVRESAMTLYRENLGHHVWADAPETMLDVYTDGMIINEAYTYGENGVTDIFLNPFMEVDGTNPTNSLYEVTALANDQFEIKYYGRYWQGYLVIIRPLLLFFNYTDIRRLNMIVQFLLVFRFIRCAACRDEYRILIPFLGMYFFLSPVTLCSSLQYSPCFYITMLMLLVLLEGREKAWGTKNPYLFLAGGILTAYFDFLTYPMITLGVPLLACLALDRECLFSLRRALRDMVLYTISWGIGYVGMWSAKWVLSSVFAGENVLANAMEQVKYRSGHFSGGYSLQMCLQYIFKSIDLRMLLLLFTALIVVFLLTNRRRLGIGFPPGLAVAFPVCFYPLIWYYFTLHHSTDNSYFTWREMAISVFGFLLIVESVLTGKHKTEDVKNQQSVL